MVSIFYFPLLVDPIELTYKRKNRLTIIATINNWRTCDVECPQNVEKKLVVYSSKEQYHT